MKDPLLTNADDRELYLERLPWYVNGTLAGSERAWMDNVAKDSPWGAEMLAKECLLKRAAAEHFLGLQEDFGLERLMARVKNSAPAQSTEKLPHSPAPVTRRPLTGKLSWLSKLTQVLSSPPYAMATVCVLLAQTTVIGWLATQPLPETSEYRSFGVAEMRTLRVTFVAGATEADIRTALRAAGSRMVGGPNLVGEYWIASSMKSLDEVKAVLQSSGQIATIEEDIAGPQGQ